MEQIAIVRVKFGNDIDYLHVRCMVYHDTDQIVFRAKRMLRDRFGEIPDKMQFAIIERKKRVRRSTKKKV